MPKPNIPKPEQDLSSLDKEILENATFLKPEVNKIQDYISNVKLIEILSDLLSSQSDSLL
jgi:hypothetical protein